MIEIRADGCLVKVVGYQHENNRAQVRFPLDDVRDMVYGSPGGTFALAYKRAFDDQFYTSADFEINDDYLIWTVGSHALAVRGDVEVQISYSTADAIAETQIFRFKVSKSIMDGTEGQGENLEDLIEQALTAAGGISAEIAAAEATLDAAVADAQAAQTAAETAQGAAETAQQEAETAKAGAEAAQEAAEGAQERAEAAEGNAAADAADAAQSASEGANSASAAALSASGAATSAAGAEADRIAAQGAKIAAEAAQAGAEAAQAAAETAVAGVETAGATQVAAVNAAGATQTGNVNTAGTTQVAAVNAAGAAVIESIPADYSELSADVSQVKNALQATDAKVETLNALELEQKTASGSEAVFEDGTGENADEVIVEIAPTQSGTGDPSMSNVRTINGWTGASVYVGAEAGTADETYSVDWETEAGTVYNGTINFTTGELTSNWVIRNISDMGVTKSSGSSETWLHRFTLKHWDNTIGGYDRRKGKTNLLSDVLKVDTAANTDGTMVGDNSYSEIYVYDSTVSTAQEFKNKYAGHYIAYETFGSLVKTYNLQPTPVTTLSGENHIWANTGDVSVTYSNSKLTAAVEAINEDIHGLSESINGTPDEETAVKVSGINFAENATKYVSSGSYETWYFPVTKGDEFCFEIGTTASTSFEARFAFATDIPAANIPGEYLTKKTCGSKSKTQYTGIAEADGYITASWWSGDGRTAYTAIVISGGISQRINSVEADINKLYEQEQRIDDINSELSDMKGQTVQLEAGIYWGANNVGSSLESQIQTSTGAAKRTVVTLPANSVLRIMGAGLAELTRLYWVFRASDGLLIDISDWHDQASPRAYYLKYDVETHIYINCANAYDHFVGIVDDIGPFVDISKSIGTTTRKIIDFDERNIRYAVRNMKRRSKSASYDPVLFLHFSDIHGDTENLSRLMEFASDYHIGHYLNDILCTGDIVKATLDDGMSWFDTVSGTNKILLLPGNHDSSKGSSASPTSATKQEMYEALFADRVANWGVTQPEGASTNYLGYYYKDYATQKLRLICLDANGSGDYQTAEVNWFTDVLEGAYDLGYAVVCAEHFGFAPNVCTGVHCTFNSDENIENEGSWTIPSGYISAVETFIGGGGTFICWLGGHVHKDRLTIHNDGHQWFIGVSTASHEGAQTQHEDSNRITGDKSQDSFNIVGIDTYKKRLTILKIGSDLTRMLAHKRYLCLDYENRTVVWND